MFVLAFKKSKKYKEQQEKEFRILTKLKVFYDSILNGNDLKTSDQIISEIINEENYPESIIKKIAEKAVKLILDEVIKKETANGFLSPDGYDNKFSKKVEC